jgi:hypothetical protein
VAVATNHEERLTQVEREVSKMEGEYRLLATRADIAEVKGGLRLLKWVFGIQFAVLIGFGAAVLNHMLG